MNVFGRRRSCSQRDEVFRLYVTTSDAGRVGPVADGKSCSAPRDTPGVGACAIPLPDSVEMALDRRTATG